MTKFLSKQHLLVKYGDKLCGCVVNNDVIIPKCSVPIYNKPPTNDEIERVYLDNVIGVIKLEQKEDGIYYTTSIFKEELKEIIEQEQRNYLKFACLGTSTKLTSINAAYISINNINVVEHILSIFN